MAHTQSEVRRYDWFKLIVTLVLLALILLSLLRGCGTPAETPATPEPAATIAATAETEVPETAEAEAAATEAAVEPSPEMTDAPEVAVAAPTFDLPDPDAILPGEPFELRGTGTPGTQVQVVVDGEVVGTADVGVDGTWTYPVTFEEPGEHTLVVEGLDADGVVAAASEPGQFTLASPLVVPTLDFPEAGVDLEAEALELRGTGTPGAVLEILDNGEVVDTVEVGADGNWTYALTPEAGAHSYAVREVGAEDAVSDAVAVTVRDVETVEPGTSACQRPEGSCQGEQYTVVRGDMLVCISRCAGVALGDLIAANPEITDPNRIYPDQLIALPR